MNQYLITNQPLHQSTNNNNQNRCRIMIILLTLLVFHLLVLFAAKRADRVNYLGYLFIGILTAVQVIVFAYFLFTMEVPTP